MAYADFTLEEVATRFGVTTRPGQVIPPLPPAILPGWLVDSLALNGPLDFVNEKSRSESVIAPILRAAGETVPVEVALYSGCRFDVDRESGLVGECDFLLAIAPRVLPIRSPSATVVVPKQADIEDGIAQCLAQMVAVARFNNRDDRPAYGCVTSGEVWQFLRLDGAVAVQDPKRLFLDNVDSILATFGFILGQFLPSG